MSVTKVQGKNVQLLIFNIDGNYQYLCGQSCSLNIQTDNFPATNIQSAGFRAYQPGKTSWDVTFNGVTMVKDSADGNFIFFDMNDELARKSGLDITLVFTNDNGNTETFGGHVYVVSNSLTGDVGSLSKFSTHFQGSGAFVRNQGIPQTKNTDVKIYPYTATGTEPNNFVNPDLINRNILFVYRGGFLDIVFPPTTPLTGQVQYTASTGSFIFGSNLGAGEKITIEYI